MDSSAILLANLGSPTAPTAQAVRAFLAPFLSDPMVVDLPRWFWLPLLHGIVLRRRPARSAQLYKKVWTEEGSPLRVETEALALALSKQMDRPVFSVYRYGSPSLDERLQELFTSGVERVSLLPLFPQQTPSSSGTIKRALEKSAAKLGRSNSVHLFHMAPDQPAYIRALKESFERIFTSASPPDHLLCSFHGIPLRHEPRTGETYQQQCQRTFTALLKSLDWDPAKATLSFQSRYGPGRWLEPATAAQFAVLGGRGIGRLAVMAPGFLTAGLETIHELGQEGRELFVGAGGGDLILIPPPGPTSAFLGAMERALEGNGNKD